MISFEHPWALGLLVVVAALAVPWRRRARRPSLAFNVPAGIGAGLPHSGRLRRIPPLLFQAFLAVLVIVLARPTLGTTEEYRVEESKTILLSVDSSGSMLGVPIQNVKAVAEDFVRGRPKEDRLGLVLFDDAAVGGILTTNHAALVKELRDLEIVPGRGTQLGIGLFKSLVSFIESDVETRLAEDQTLTVGQREARFKELRREIDQFAGFLLRKEPGDFVPHLPGVGEPAAIGKGKVLILLTDADFLKPDSAEERINYVQVLGYYERFGLERLYVLSRGLELPRELMGIFSRNPGWRFYRFQVRDEARLRDMFSEITRLERGRSLTGVRTEHRQISHWFTPALALLLVGSVLPALSPRFRSVP
jgi:hypothetical protein